VLARDLHLQTELEAHRQAVVHFVAAAECVDAAEWNAQRRAGAWSPAQIAEHLRLAYVTVCAGLHGRPGFRVRTNWWQRRLLRLFYLRAILDEGRFPRGVPATSETRPGSGPFDRSLLLADLRREAEEFMTVVASSRSVSITNPLLGELALLDGIRLLTQHVHHHRSQLLPADK